VARTAATWACHLARSTVKVRAMRPATLAHALPAIPELSGQVFGPSLAS